MIQRIITILAALLCVAGAQAQSLTGAQIATLRTSILADGALAPKCTAPIGDAPYEIQAAYNAAASPTFVVWRTSVSIRETGQAFNGTEWAGMTSANHTRLQTVAQYLSAGYSAAPADIRAMFNDIWSGAGGTTTRANLLALWKRSSTRFEKLYATGTGSDAAPATLVVEGALSITDVQRACPGG